MYGEINVTNKVQYEKLIGYSYYDCNDQCDSVPTSSNVWCENVSTSNNDQC